MLPHGNGLGPVQLVVQGTTLALAVGQGTRPTPVGMIGANAGTGADAIYLAASMASSSACGSKAGSSTSSPLRKIVGVPVTPASS